MTIAPICKAEISPRAAKLWNKSLAPSNGKTIEILGVIGEDYWDEGTTAKDISKALKDSGDITVTINSPGGDFFEGLTIYNMLREHPGNVTIEVLGVAASAASIIAMAGDEVKIAKSGFLMIHNTWVVAAGNRHDFSNLIKSLETFDNTLSEIYQARSGLDLAAIQSMLDQETWLSGSEAVDAGLADNFLSADKVDDKESTDTSVNALRQVDAMLAKASMPRTERRELLNQIKGKQDAADSKQDAALENELNQLLNLLKGK